MFDKKLLPLTYLFNLMLRVIGVVSFIYIEFTGITHFEIEVLANVANNRRDTKKTLNCHWNERVNKWLTTRNSLTITKRAMLLSQLHPPPPRTKRHTIEAWFAIYAKLGLYTNFKDSTHYGNSFAMAYTDAFV